MNNLKSIVAADGVDLSGIGINGYAFKADIALKLIELFREESTVILGGDVLKIVDLNKYDLTYDNWSYEGSNVFESCKEAESYIKNYKYKNGDEFLYQLIT
ncbi:Imm40 family immunity protein [Endozoicomonas sp. ALD040]|uniref:Imm40 family immunity protein n=1 Tax=Endozoicomonas sp. ALD040 TaxID=3403079 RepID=UPI003BB1C9F5